MDLTLDQTQLDIIDYLREQLHMPLDDVDLRTRFEAERYRRLAEGGYLDVARDGGELLNATVAVEAAAMEGACVPLAARALVAPALLRGELPGVVALVDLSTGALARFGEEAATFLVLDGPTAAVATREQVTVVPQQMRWGYPVARITVNDGARLETADQLRRLWQIALAAEGGGLMRSAVLLAARYVSERAIFGRPLGGYQAVQHHLARAWVAAEASTWLARQATCVDEPVLASAAACYSADAMRTVMRNVHQVCGAIGVTDEFGLSRYTAKLAYLQTELGGADTNARFLARQRWFDDARPDESVPVSR